MIGKTIGKCRVLEKIGEGGMGVVYKAEQLSLGRKVAMKVLPEHLTRVTSFVERFMNEARAMAAVNHPNIVQIHDVGNEGEIYYYTMEFIDGTSLDDILLQRGRVPLDRALRIVSKVAKALEYMHKEGIVHRDIKPSNIMIDKLGTVKLTDFGLALQQTAERVTLAGGIIGTPEYMSPEQTQGETATPLSDIYSLGVVFYELLTGRVPFEADTPLSVVRKIQTEEPPSPRSINPEISIEVETVICNMMAKNPGDRYASCREIMSDFRGLKSGISMPVRARRLMFFQLLLERIARLFRMTSQARDTRATRLFLLGLIVASMIAYLVQSPRAWYRLTGGIYRFTGSLQNILWPPPPPPPRRWSEVKRYFALTEGKFMTVRQQCEDADFPPLKEEFEQIMGEFVWIKGQLEKLPQKYERDDQRAFDDELDQLIRRAASLENKVNDIWEECPPRLKVDLDRIDKKLGYVERQLMRRVLSQEECQVSALKNELDRAEQGLASLQRDLGSMRKLYLRRERPALKKKINSMEHNLASLQDGVKDIWEGCVGVVRHKLRQINIEIGLLEEHIIRIQQQCEQHDVVTFKNELSQMRQREASLDNQLKNISQQCAQDDLPIFRDELEQMKQKIGPLEKQVNVLHDYLWPDLLLLKNGKMIRAEILKEWPEKVRIRKKTSRGEVEIEILRSHIKEIVPKTHKRIAEILRVEAPKIEERIGELRKDISALRGPEKALETPESEDAPLGLTRPEKPLTFGPFNSGKKDSKILTLFLNKEADPKGITHELSIALPKGINVESRVSGKGTKLAAEITISVDENAHIGEDGLQAPYEGTMRFKSDEPGIEVLPVYVPIRVAFSAK